MAWSHLQGAGANSAAAATISVAYSTANLSSGSKLTAWVATNSAGTATSTTAVKDSSSNSYGSLGSGTETTDHMSLSLWVLDTPAGDVGTKPTITATCSGTGTSAGLAISIQEFSGLMVGQTTSILDGGAVNFTASASSGTTQNFPTFSSTASNELLEQCYSDPGTSFTIGTPTGYTGLDGSNTNGNAECVVGWKNSTGGSETGSWSAPGADPLIVAEEIGRAHV